MVWTIGLALLVDTVDGEEAGQYLGYVGISMSVAFLAGPLLGGVVFAEQGYEAVFAMCWGLIGLDVVLRLILVEQKVAVKWKRRQDGLTGQRDNDVTDEKQGKIDEGQSAIDTDKADASPREDTDIKTQGSLVSPAGAEQSSLNIQPSSNNNTQIRATESTARNAISSSSDRPHTSTLALASADANNLQRPDTMASPNECVTSEHTRARATMFGTLLHLVSSPRLLASLWGTVINATLATALDSTLPNFVRVHFQWNAVAAGLTLLPLLVPSFLSPLIGWASDRYGPRFFAALGFVVPMPFLVALRVVEVGDSIHVKITLCGLLVGVGVGLVLTLPPLMAEISYIVVEMEKRRPGVFGEGGAVAQAVGESFAVILFTC